MSTSIESLDIRLRRLEYALTGSTEPPSKTDLNTANIPSQISTLNDRLTKLANQNKSVRRVLQACIFLIYLIDYR
jgi:hypothetical protein